MVISCSGGNSAIDTEQGYQYTGGSVIAIMPQGGMTDEATKCQSFSSVGYSARLSLDSGDYLIVNAWGQTATVRMPVSISGTVILLGDSSPTVTTESSASVSLDENGVGWN